MSGQRSGILLAIGAGAVLAAITHIVAVLAAPHVASRNAHRRLAGDAAERIVVLPRAAAGAQAIPYQDPAVAIAAPQDDVGVRIVGVPVIDGDPL